jgi:hypothetical protein
LRKYNRKLEKRRVKILHFIKGAPVSDTERKKGGMSANFGAICVDKTAALCYIQYE